MKGVVTQTLLTLAAVWASAGAASACTVPEVKDISAEGGTRISLSYRYQPNRMVDMGVTVDREMPRDQLTVRYRNEVASNIPASSCSRRYEALPVALRVEGERLHLMSAIRTRQFICTPGTCCRGLKCRKCTWDEQIFRKTLDLNTYIRPELINGPVQSINISGSTSLEELEGWEKRLLEGLRGVGNILDISLLNLTDVSDEFIYRPPDLPSFVLLREQFERRPNFNPRFVSVSFLEEGGQVLLRAIGSERRKCSVAIQIANSILRSAKVQEQLTPGAFDYVVRDGESLWEIAERNLFDGRYHVALAQYNELPINSRLLPGQRLRIPNLAALNSATPHVVQPNDSLWKISQGNPELFRRSLETFGAQRRNRTLIYPGELVVPDRVSRILSS